MTQPVASSDLLRAVLMAAAIASGNRARFLQAGLIDESGDLLANWQTAFGRLKPLRKDEVRQHPGSFLAQADDVVYRGTTSGTTAAAFTYFGGEQWNYQRIKAREQSLAWWGFDPNIPVLNVASRLGPVRLQDSSLVGQIDFPFLQMLLQLVAARPVIIRGYPSRLCEVVVALHRYGLFPPADKVIAVIATGECLFEAQRSLLQNTFHAPVVNEYGAQESGISGLSCPEAGRLHLAGDRCLYELIEGELLTTDLHNTTMPMVRYSSGDVLTLCQSDCPCGRPGPTAKVLGRDEEAIALKDKQRWPGEINLPVFEGVLSYQIQLHADQDCLERRLWLQPESILQPDSLTAIKQWMQASFGDGSTEILIESPLAEAQAENSLEIVSSAEWIEQVTTGAWSIWLQQPLPSGQAQAIAALLQQLVAPRYIVAKGLSPQTLRQIIALAASERSPDRNLEAIKIRVLLWATSLLTEGLTELNAADFYNSLLGRFEQWCSENTADIEQFSALGFDLLAPLLTLETPTVRALWPSIWQSIQRCWPKGIKADAFTMHHYLAALDIAGHNAQLDFHPWLPALRPLAAVLLGDFYQCASTLTAHTVALWAEVVHSCPGEFSELEAVCEAADFYGVWAAGRRSLLTKNRALVMQHLDVLFERATSPAQIAQCWLEKGYAMLVLRDSLDPIEWVGVLKEQVGILDQSLGEKPAQSLTNPMPWVPILRALAPELANVNQPSLAYACLFAAAPPNRKLSSFDSQSRGVNGKQSVIKMANKIAAVMP
ncbi:MAG: hypothetical protein WBA76_09145 [Phormidesmis sp.]